MVPSHTSQTESNKRIKLKFDDVSSEYIKRKKHNIVLRHVSFEIYEGEFVSLLGPSGAGKSTLVKTILGLQDYGGNIYLDGNDIESIPLRERHLAYIAQRRILYPSMTVYDNIAFPLKNLRMDSNYIKERVLELAKKFDIELLLPRRIKQLSIGQQQRVALARAMANNASLFIFDEPFASIDVASKQEIWSNLRELSSLIDGTFFFITHDLKEASAFSDRLIILNEGKVEQVGTIDEIIRKPKTEFVSSLFSNDTFDIEETRNGK